MGLFLSMSGVATNDRPAIEDALRSYAEPHDGHLQTLDCPAEYSDVLVMLESPSGRTTIAYPGEFFDWDDASRHLSQCLQGPVFSFHIHDGDLWMYVLYENGHEVDAFNPVPDYWNQNLSEREFRHWSGDAARVAATWPDVAVVSIENYLVRWNLMDYHPRKAYPDDRSTFNDCWQLLDFMRRLGLDYPFADGGEPHGDLYRFEVWGDTDI